jgi:LPS sulfotransferase NodH
MKPTTYYVICSSPRSGSTLLAQALAVMGIGNPGEFLNPSLLNEQEWGGPDKFMKPSPRSLSEYCHRRMTFE